MGLDVQLFEEEVAPELLCTSCSKVLVHPVQATCSHLFCQACLKRCLKTADPKQGFTCPACGTSLKTKTPGRPPSVDVKVKLLNLLIRCSHGCGKVCSLADLPDHVADECPYAPVTCPHVHQGCKMRVKRVELQEHVEECQHRYVHCEACGQRTIYVDLFTHQSRKRCLEKKLRQQLIKAVKITNTEVKQHRRQLQRQHIRLEQQQRQRLMDHYRQTTTTASRFQRHRSGQQHYLHGHSNGSSSNVSEYDSPRAPVFINAELQDAVAPQHVTQNVDTFLTSQPDDGEMTLALNTPSPSRTGMSVGTCRNCRKLFRENLNSPHSCRWHQGLFTCYSCGRLDYQKGCMMGYHEL